MMYRAVIFDLDGTLLNTLEDLTDAVNGALSAHAFPLRTVDEVRRFVGNGVEKLMERAVPSGKENPVFDACFAEFKALYTAHCRDKTCPYPGIPELLDKLRAAGIPTAIVSNKYDDAVKELNAAYFGDLVPVAVGEREGVRKKPAPDTALEALRLLGFASGADSGAVYVGDSDVDVATAKAAGIPCISVTWGFRDRACLTAAGAVSFADTTEQLWEMLTEGTGERGERRTPKNFNKK